MNGVSPQAMEEPPRVGRMAEVTPFDHRDANPSGGHRPQALLLSFLGGIVWWRDKPAIPTAVFLRLLDSLGVAEAAARATLTRMTRNGLLERTQAGRVAHYRLTAQGEALIRKANERVGATAPFGHHDGQWTLLIYSMPESRRDLRHRLRAVLTWAGFGGLRDGVWIAPGAVDVAAVFADAGLEEVAGLAEWFTAAPMPGVGVEQFIRRAWPVDRIREQHEAFLLAWGDGPGDGDALGRLTLLGADWLRLLRADPGLPGHYLSRDWPAARSAAVFAGCRTALLPAAYDALDRELGFAVPG